VLYGDGHFFINGESYRMASADAPWLMRLANQRGLAAADVRRATPNVRRALKAWVEQGWLSPTP